MKRTFWLTSLVLLIGILCASKSFGQNVQIRGGFIADSLKIGEEVGFYLAASYPSDQNILFPDSGFRYSPFEYERKEYFATVTNNGISYDSTVYFLKTFEIDTLQKLALPVYLLQANDCTTLLSNTDEIRLLEMIKWSPDTVAVKDLPLMAIVNYENIYIGFNLMVTMAAIGILLITALMVWVFFGSRIQKHFRAKTLERRHKQFTESYNRLLKDATNAFSIKTAESAVTLWKKYMEQLEGKPYTKLTTKETIAFRKDAALGDNLKNIDRAIYGHDHNVVNSLSYLQQVATEQYSSTLKELSHGK